jgi:hypothetical protein
MRIRGNDGVLGWILSVGTLVQLSGCSGVDFALGRFSSSVLAGLFCSVFAVFASGGPVCGADRKIHYNVLLSVIRGHKHKHHTCVPCSLLGIRRHRDERCTNCLAPLVSSLNLSG